MEDVDIDRSVASSLDISSLSNCGKWISNDCICRISLIIDVRYIVSIFSVVSLCTSKFLIFHNSSL
jgi:hypothetical protein